MDIDYNLENMQINLKIKYLNNLINGCSKLNIIYDNVKIELNKYLQQDNQNYSITDQNNKIINSDNKITDQNNKIIDQNNKITDQNNKISKSDTEKGGNITETETIDYLYLKPWSKLTQIHKVIKIKEFVNNLDIINQLEIEILKDNIINQIKEKKIKNKINYDETKGKILSISNLSFNNDKYILN
jgi:hypothetical protein